MTMTIYRIDEDIPHMNVNDLPRKKNLCVTCIPENVFLAEDENEQIHFDLLY